jgi:hypothetical protein
LKPLDFDTLKLSFMEYLQEDPIRLEVECLQASYHIDIEDSYSVSESIPAPEAPLEELLDTAKQSLSLGAYIREKAHRRDMVTYRPAFFERGQISRDYWSRLLNDEVKASKEKLLRVAILLRLSVDDAEAMLEKAGYALSPSILRDVALTFCLQRRMYDFVKIEALLADHQVQSLFNDRRGG